jgi:alpha-D-ribose 1-methylphosphonate 5-triphosphate synthase subunit PhnG
MDRATHDWRRRALKAEAEVAELRVALLQQSDGKKDIAAAVLEATAAQHAAEAWALVALITCMQVHFGKHTLAPLSQPPLEVPA